MKQRDLAGIIGGLSRNGMAFVGAAAALFQWWALTLVLPLASDSWGGFLSVVKLPVPAGVLDVLPWIGGGLCALCGLMQGAIARKAVDAWERGYWNGVRRFCLQVGVFYFLGAMFWGYLAFKIGSDMPMPGRISEVAVELYFGATTLTLLVAALGFLAAFVVLPRGNAASQAEF